MKLSLDPRLFAMLAFLILAGCEYQSSITAPETPIDDQLLGTWSVKDPKDGPTTLRFRKLNAFEYLIELESVEKGKRVKEYGKGFLSVINDVHFINYQDHTNSRFLFDAYEFDKKGRLILRNTRLDVLADASSFSIRQAIRKQLEEKSLFGTTTIWRKNRG